MLCCVVTTVFGCIVVDFCVVDVDRFSCCVSFSADLIVLLIGVALRAIFDVANAFVSFFFEFSGIRFIFSVGRFVVLDFVVVLFCVVVGAFVVVVVVDFGFAGAFVVAFCFFFVVAFAAGFLVVLFFVVVLTVVYRIQIFFGCTSW